jgi:hypothetical protein
VDDVLASIEFELAQGCISRDDLGASIQAVRQYQNKLRGEALELVKRPEDMQEVVTRLFQINEMLSRDGCAPDPDAGDRRMVAPRADGAA